MTLDESIMGEAKDARGKLIEAEHEVERTRSDYHYAIRRLHAAGGSLREIADSLGLSHQRVHQIVDAGGKDPGDVLWQMPFSPAGGVMPVCPPPGMIRRRGRKRPRGFFTRFSGEARKVVGDAQEAAASLGHAYVGTEHLLLALFEEPRTSAALQALGLDRDAVRAKVVEEIGEGSGDVPGRRPFTPRAKRTLELALREALDRGDKHIGAEHLLFGLVAEGEGTGAEILGAAGVTAERLREQLAR